MAVAGARARLGKPEGMAVEPMQCNELTGNFVLVAGSVGVGVDQTARGLHFNCTIHLTFRASPAYEDA
jgi:hypothetical protein